jgi:hypothetical protein
MKYPNTSNSTCFQNKEKFRIMPLEAMLKKQKEQSNEVGVHV